MATSIDKILERGYAALEVEDLDEVRAAVAAAVDVGIDDDDARLRYLRFMTSWLDEQSSDEELDAMLGDTSGLLAAAIALEAVDEAARITLDLTDVLAQIGEFDEAEHALRELIARDDLSPEADGEARLLCAQIVLDHHEDPSEALELLDRVHPSLHEDIGYISLRAAILGDLERKDEAIELLAAALERNPDIELHYQLGLLLRAVGRGEQALEHLLAVREHDLGAHEIALDEPVLADEVEDLRRQLEDVLDTLPDKVLNRIAAATIRVERWPSEATIRMGADPRAPVAFEGVPAGDEGEGQVDALVLYRDVIVAEIEDDEEIPEVIAIGLVEEFDRYFELELIPGVM
jgi:tetratricopeptide (TPR) repeat protein